MSMGNKKKILVAAISACAILSAAGITMAMLSKQSQAVTNEFQGAGVNIGVLENGNLLEDEGGHGDNVQEYPKIEKDKPVQKIVQIQNIDSEEYPTTDTYVRVRLVPIFRDADGASVAADMSKVQYTFGNKDGLWKKEKVSGEMYYYYTKALAPNESTSSLIEAVTYTGDVPEGTHFELQVLTEGLAASQSGALSAWGISDGFRNMENVG